jgi:sulfite reductase beta subunit-like hemoprotein/NADPH-dependent glutamate synthase beta subunit-like oxidoreductase/ferredoxin
VQRNLAKLRRCDEEAVKEAGLVLDYDEIARKGSMSREEISISKWYGIYQSRQAGNHMARVVIPGGQLTSVQARELARLSKKYAPGRISVTTRQSMQLHCLKLKELAPFLREIKAAGLTTFHGCGDVTRNVAACPWAEICPHRRLDVLPYAKAIAEHLASRRDLDNLPRKFKITLSGCGGDCGQPHINCVGITAIMRARPDGTKETGFRVVIGGGMGWKPFVAKPLYGFVPAEKIVDVCRAVGYLFRDHGDRYIRMYARLKFVVHRLGIERCRELVDEYLDKDGVDRSGFVTEAVRDIGGTMPDRPLTIPDWPLCERHPVGTDGLCIQQIKIPKGELSSEHLERIAELAEMFGDKHVYGTNRQNLELHGVDPRRLPALKREIESLGFETEDFFGLSDVVSCVGTTYCPLAVSTTHRLFDKLQDLVHDKKYEAIRDKVLVNITGCPNSCSPYRIADIGFRGLRVREMEGSREGYQMTVGGTQTNFGQVVGEFKEDDCVYVTAMILDTFMKVRQDHESLADSVLRFGSEAFLQAAGSFKTDGMKPADMHKALVDHMLDAYLELRQGNETLEECLARVGVEPYRRAVESLGIEYEKAVNPLELTVVTGHAGKPLDFRTIERDVPCRTACPARTNIPEYIRHIAHGRMDEAAIVNQEDNVLSGILGRICTRPCETRCRYQWTNIKGPVRICHLKRCSTDGKTRPFGPLPAYFGPSGKKTAIIGGGPAGLAAARELRRCGHEVTIFEREAYLGGQIRIGIPEFRLPREIIEEDINAILAQGVEVKLNRSIRKEEILELAMQYDAVLLAAGANKPRTLKLEGLPDGAAIEGLHFMQRFNDGRPDAVRGDVLIVGGGFTAVDCARTSRRLLNMASATAGLSSSAGITAGQASSGTLDRKSNVSIVYRRGEAQMAATHEELQAMREEDIRIETLVAPVAAKCENGKLKAVVFQRNILGKTLDGGKPAFLPVAGSEFEMPCDTLIFAIGQERETEILPPEIRIGEDHATNVPGLFVGGDFLGANSADVINAVADGKIAAEKIDAYLMGENRRNKFLDVKPAEITGRLRDHDLVDTPEMPMLPLERRGPTDEVELGFDDAAADLHAWRCYLCNYKFEIDQDKCIHCDWCIKVSPRNCILRLGKLLRDQDGAARSWSEVPADQLDAATYIWIDSDQCIRCGNCINICPVDAISVRKCDVECENMVEG